MTTNKRIKATPIGSNKKQPVIQLKSVTMHYGTKRALDDITLDIPQGKMVGLIGPDGVGKSSLLSLITGAHCIQSGLVNVLNGDMADKAHRLKTCPDIAYMPQGLGKNLYPTLSVDENAQFFARLFGQGKEERSARIVNLLQKTGLNGFEDRPAGKLSGGMKQKLGLICSLIHDPRLLVLDEPTTGVDPLSRRQFWDLIDSIRDDGLDMSVLVATAYMEEAARFDWLIAMNAGKVLATGTPQELLEKTNTKTLNDAFIALMPKEERENHRAVVIPPRVAKSGNEDIAIEANGLTKKFGNFTAVDHVNFRIPKGEIFGFLGSNGCGKTTTMKMLTGLLPTSEGTAKLFGKEVETGDIESRRNVGYMSQAFSLYSELTVYENLALHAKLFEIPEDKRDERIQIMMDRFDLNDVKDAMPDELPLGIRQRMSLAVALIHDPKMLILDEPTSGVDPIARDSLWESLGKLSREEDVTIFISTHFMDEAARCDRISLMNAGQVIISDTPDNIIKNKQADTLEDAFIDYLQEAIDEKALKDEKTNKIKKQNIADPVLQTAKQEKASNTKLKDVKNYLQNTKKRTENKFFSPLRMFAYAWREALELKRDPIRATMALLGSVLLMLVIGYGINLDVQNLRFAVLDYDQTELSRNYIQELSGSRYFIQQPDIINSKDMEERMRSGEISLAIEIPPNFAADIKRGRNAEVGAFLDGAMPMRAEIIRGYVMSTHTLWLQKHANAIYGKENTAGNYNLEVRFRYNPSIESLTAMAPAVIPILLLIIPAMLAALSVVREKEMGSIINLYVTPTTALEFILGKQLPYVILGMINFILLWIVAVFFFKVDFTGSFFTFFIASLLYICFSTGYGLLISTFMNTQIAAIFAVAVFTIIPSTQFCGLINPVSSLEGIGRFLGEIFPTTYYITVARGTFSKALDFTNLANSFIPLLLVPLIIIIVATLFTRKQER